MKIEIGSMVRFVDNHVNRVWGNVGKIGEVLGVDSSNSSGDVYIVRLNDGFSVYNVGVHKSHFEVIEKDD